MLCVGVESYAQEMTHAETVHQRTQTQRQKLASEGGKAPWCAHFDQFLHDSWTIFQDFSQDSKHRTWMRCHWSTTVGKASRGGIISDATESNVMFMSRVRWGAWRLRLFLIKRRRLHAGGGAGSFWFALQEWSKFSLPEGKRNTLASKVFFPRTWGRLWVFFDSGAKNLKECKVKFYPMHGIRKHQKERVGRVSHFGNSACVIQIHCRILFSPQYQEWTPESEDLGFSASRGSGTFSTVCKS